MTTSTTPSLDSLLIDASDRFAGRGEPRAATDSAKLIAATTPIIAPPADFATAQAAGSLGWSAEGAERAGRDAAKVLSTMGIALDPPVYAMGSLLNTYGVERAGELRAEFEALPIARAAMSKLQIEVTAEQRCDIVVNVADLRMNARGALVHPAILTAPSGVIKTAAGGTVRVEGDALSKLARGLRNELGIEGDLGIRGLAGSNDADLVTTAAKVWNDAATVLGRREAAALPNSKGEAPKRYTATLRTRLGRRVDEQGRELRQVFAVVSEAYGECDTNKIAAAIAKMQNSDKLRASVHYDRTGVSIDLFSHTTVAPTAFVAGEVYRVGIRITSDDTGGGSITIHTLAERNLCLNVQIVHVGEGATTRIRHLGDPDKVAAKLDAALAAAHKAIEQFVKQWDTSARESVTVGMQATKREHTATVADILEDYAAAQDRAALARDILEGTYRGLLEEIGLVGTRQIEETVPRLVAAHWDPRNESGIRDQRSVTRGSVVNGLTLWAQDLEPSKAHEVEVLAGRITAGEVDFTYSPRPVAATAAA